ncbi:hypothetical protein TBLA_0C03740 [Henningerozyma blattae CBS 6284]|uniref:Homeobox domain-containing protein n=1 Tax=Henningerozyma blattae (strain ATCC 34711 / CBS 6284 / DSM 70876 / NBRC 10599 / NRRL Y-10934 / UCD 77-7) TaxID=1071380 RepID=I2H1C5_HENB6|nr:hypothetical protein TBLA_0C03740 [Tetrapisispora blattae CBS 6284]CCH60177.1 hypothetical protein TBLA_0C03740 [Tetrapisispora blattae CBS 6284]
MLPSIQTLFNAIDVQQRNTYTPLNFPQTPAHQNINHNCNHPYAIKTSIQTPTFILPPPVVSVSPTTPPQSHHCLHSRSSSSSSNNSTFSMGNNNNFNTSSSSLLSLPTTAGDSNYHSSLPSPSPSPLIIPTDKSAQDNEKLQQNQEHLNRDVTVNVTEKQTEKNHSLKKSKLNYMVSKRSNLPKETVQILNDWLLNHLRNPYPTPKEKSELLVLTGLTKIQLSNWFINVRRRKVFSDYYVLAKSTNDNDKNTSVGLSSDDENIDSTKKVPSFTKRKRLSDRLEELKKISNNEN